MNDLHIGEKLKLLRKKHSMTQSEVAYKLGVDRSTYTYYEVSRSNPSLGTLKKICVLFHVSADSLLGINTHRTQDSKMALQPPLRR